MSATPPTSPANKLLGLEVLRFFSAMAVLVWHYQHFAFVGSEPVDFLKDQQPFFAVLKPLYGFGYYGVQIFWCISGYIFFWKYQATLASRRIGGKEFFLLRFSRLYPLHFVTLLLVAALQPIYFALHQNYFVYPNNDVPHFLLQLFIASEWGFTTGSSFNGPIWSISLEVVAYLTFFCVMRLFGTSLVASFALVAVWVAVTLMNLQHPILECVAYFFAGGIVAALGRRASPAIQPRLRISSIALALLAPPVAVLLRLDHYANFNKLFLLVYIPVLLYCLAECIQAPRSVGRYIEVAGNMTYSSYLTHFPIQLLIMLVYTSLGKAVPMYSATFFLLYMAAILVLSFLVFEYFEAPAQRIIRERYLRNRRTAQPAPVADS